MTGVVMFLMFGMASMTMMHEEVHQRAGQQRQPYQEAENMGAVLREQERACDDQEAE